MADGYQKLSSACSVCDHAPLYKACHGTGDHEAVARLLCRWNDSVCLPIRVINGLGHPWRAVNSRRAKVSELNVHRC